jgi:hypothetical protein
MTTSITIGAVLNRPGSTSGGTTTTINATSNIVAPIVIQNVHGLQARQAVYLGATGWTLAINTANETLGRYIVSQVFDANSFSLALPMQIIAGFTGLTPAAWYHTSVTTAGAIEPVSLTQSALPGAFAANPIGQAISSTELIFVPHIPFQI